VPREIITQWTTQSGSDHRTIMWFDTAGVIADQRAALNVFWSAVDGVLDSNVSWVIETSGREVADATGTLTGQWSEPTAYGGTGGVAGECVPDAAQVLIRWNTGDIVNGSFVQGRNYIPGLAQANVVAGNLAPSIVTALEGHGNTLSTLINGIGVWHRPILSAGGSFHLATTCEVWSELAVLRRRR